MRSSMKTVILGSVLAAGALALILLSGNTGRAEEECAPLVQNKCSTCHFVTHICPKIAQGKGNSYWKGIVEKMIGHGMVATDQEQRQITTCLASPDAKVKALCPNP